MACREWDRLCDTLVRKHVGREPWWVVLTAEAYVAVTFTECCQPSSFFDRGTVPVNLNLHAEDDVSEREFWDGRVGSNDLVHQRFHKGVPIGQGAPVFLVVGWSRRQISYITAGPMGNTRDSHFSHDLLLFAFKSFKNNSVFLCSLSS